MTYAPYEISNESSRPIEVYRFDLGSESYYYTSAEDVITIDGVDYQPEGISRGKLAQGQEDRGQPLEVTVPSTNVLARLYISVVPGARCLLTIKRVQRSDFPSPEVRLIFTGFVQSVAFTEQGKVAKIAALPIESAASRPIPNYTYQGLCNHVHYSTNGCQLDKADFDLSVVVTAVTGNVITCPGASAFPDEYFTAGFVEALGGLDARMILGHTGDDVTLLIPFPFSAIGQTMVLYAGCDHTPEACGTKFDNIINYGGFFFVPHINIFETGL